MTRLLTALTNAFPIWLILGSVLAWIEPSWFTWFRGPWIVWGLTVIMLGMGLTLTFEDFRSVGRMPRAVALGLAAQFIIMPFLGWGLGRLFNLETPYAVGLILVACCPGGTASNVVTYLARANVSLSVVMTMCSTFAAVVLTPALTAWLAGTLVQVDGWGLLWSTVQVVILPVIIGLWINRLAPRAVQRAQTLLPFISVAVIAMICASVIGGSADAVARGGWRVLGAVIALHSGGFALGYVAARIVRFDRVVARTVSIEVGMQNSGLGVVLARQHFADPLTALPSALASMFQSVLGSLLAGWWRWRNRDADSASASSESPR